MAKPSKTETATVKPAAIVVAAEASASASAPPPVKKEKKAKDAAAVAVAVPVAAQVQPVAVAEPAKKKSKTAVAAAVTSAVVPESAATAPVSDAAAVTDAAVAIEVSSISGDFSDFFGKLQLISTQLASLRTDFRNLEKKASREIKTATKAGAKRKRKTGNRSPSGFVKPTLISVDLAAFLGKPHGTEMARTEVTREINAYIRANNLQDKTNGRKINADAKLASLLKLTAGGEDLTYFNLQRYMSPHFQKSAAAAAAAASATAAL